MLKFCIKQVDKGQISTNDSSVSSLSFALMKGLMLKMSASLYLHGGNLTLVNLFDTKV